MIVPLLFASLPTLETPKVPSGAAKRNHDLIEAVGLVDENDLEFWRGKFRRTCEPKRASGNLEIPDDIFQQYQAKGASRDKLFELFVKSGGDKDPLPVICKL